MSNAVSQPAHACVGNHLRDGQCGSEVSCGHFIHFKTSQCIHDVEHETHSPKLREDARCEEPAKVLVTLEDSSRTIPEGRWIFFDHFFVIGGFTSKGKEDP